MENGQSTSASQAQNFIIELVNEESRPDVLTRRLKNRERQRRYRARKRLESDPVMPSVSTPVTPEVMDPDPIAIVRNWTARVYSPRDWKKDARNAHAYKNSEVISPKNASVAKSESPFERDLHPDGSRDTSNYAPNCTMSVRRDWKAEARNRKT